MLVHIHTARMVLQVNPYDGRIWGAGRAGASPPGNAVPVRGLIATPCDSGFEGDHLKIDYYGLVTVENWMRGQYPRLRHSTVRRRLRRFVSGPFLNDLLKLRDGIDHKEMALVPWGEGLWLVKEAARSAWVSRMMNALCAPRSG